MNLFEYDDYRNFLKNWLIKKPKKGRGELSKMAEFMRIHPSAMSQILAGQKDFSVENAYDICEYLALNAIERDYFMTLVQLERAGTQKLRSYHVEKLNHLKSDSMELAKRVTKDRVLTEKERAIFYSSWIYSAIRLFCSTSEGGKSFDDICKYFDLDRTKATEILNFLCDTGLCRKDDGQYILGEQITHLESSSPYVVRHHTNWRLKAMQKADRLNKEELMFTGPLSISKKDFEKTREEIVQFIKGLSDRVKNSDPDQLACINIDFFKL